MPSVTLHPADAEDLSYVERLLERTDLPHEVVRPTADVLYYSTDVVQRVGVGCVERYGADRLLRSLVVESSQRGLGYGTELWDALETEEKKVGGTKLYLLTRTAADFFGARGYVEIDRADVPTAIRETTEFTDLCPETAVCLHKSL
jgi:amino-acid N-acetyltransferase